MTGSAAIYSLLSNDSAVTAYVSDRIYPVNVPDQIQYPAIVYSQLSEDELDSKDAPIHNGYLFSVDIYAGSYNQAQVIANAARKALHWRTVTVEDLGTVRFKMEDRADTDLDEEKDMYHTALDFRGRIIG